MNPMKPCAMLFAAAVMCLSASHVIAAEKPAANAMASALDYVPSDALVVISIRVADYWNEPRFKVEREALRAGLPEGFESFRSYFGMEPDKVERLTYFSVADSGLLGPYGPSLEPAIVVTAVKPYDRKAILKGAAVPSQREERIKFLDDHTFVIGMPGSLDRYLKRPADGKEGPMAPVLKIAAEKHLIVMGMNVSAVAKGIPPADKLPPELKPFRPLLKAQFATFVVDLDDHLRADVKAAFANDADAKEGGAAIDDALDMARGAFVQGLKQLSDDTDAPKMVAFLKDIQAALRMVKAAPKGAAVEVEASLKINPKETAAAAMEAVVKVREAANRIQISNDFKQLALGAISYADANNGGLPSDVYDKNGKPLLSWRVQVLPYIEGGPLYSQFHLDEPWDSEHNKKLLEKMPETFAPKDSEAYKNHETSFQAFVGKGTVFERPAGPRPGQFGNGLRYPADIPDGTSNTILFVEARKAVPWTKPDDVPYDEGKLLPKVGSLSKGGFFAALCDGSVRFIPFSVKEETLRMWIIRYSGQVRPELDK
jgi:Protein of unknown function (DUF1559)